MRYGFVVCVLASISITAGAQKTVPGWYQEELEVVATAGRPAALRAVIRTWRVGYQSRVERVDEQLPQMAALEYVLANASTHERYTVNVANRYIRRNTLTNAEFETEFPDTAQRPRTLAGTVESMGDGGRPGLRDAQGARTPGESHALYCGRAGACGHRYHGARDVDRDFHGESCAGGHCSERDQGIRPGRSAARRRDAQ